MATRVQSAAAEGDPASATFGATPTAGDLLVALGMERSGTAVANATISGSGWTQRIARNVQQSDSIYRRSMVVWTKVAGASEPTNVQYDDGTANTKKLLIQEFGFESGEDQWVFLEKAENDNGATFGATALSTGTTASVSDTAFLVVGVLAVKVEINGSNLPSGISWTNGLASTVTSPGGSNGRGLGSGFLTTATGGTWDSTGTISGGNTSNNGLVAGILVFSLVAAAVGSVASAAGTATVLATSRSTAASTAVSAGGGTATGVGASQAASTAASIGVGTALGIGASQTEVTAASAGVGTAQAAGRSYAEAAAASTGAGTATGGGASLAEAPATSVGSATVMGVSFTAGSAGASAGAGTASAIGRTLWAATATVLGVGMPLGSGRSLAVADVAASGIGTGSGVGCSAVAGTASSSGIATVTGRSLTVGEGNTHYALLIRRG